MSRQVFKHVGATTQFIRLPVPGTSKIKHLVQQLAILGTVGSQEVAVIREWQRFALATEYQAVDFHDRQAGCELISLVSAEVQRLVPECSIEDSCPGGGMKNRGVGVNQDPLVPRIVVKGIGDIEA